MSSLVRDHVTYSRNKIQVIDPICGLLLGIQRDSWQDTTYERREAAHCRSVRELGMSKMDAALCSIILSPTFIAALPPVSASLAHFKIGNSWGDAVIRWLEAKPQVQDIILYVGVNLLLFASLVLLSKWAWSLFHRAIEHQSPRTWALRSIPFRGLRLVMLVTVGVVIWPFLGAEGAEAETFGVLMVGLVIMLGGPWIGFLPSPLPAMRKGEKASS
jgi:hypothetical protein